MKSLILRLKVLRRTADKNRILICSFILLLVGTNLLLCQSKKDELYSKRKKLQDEISFTSKLLESTSKKKGLRENQVRLLDSKIKKRQELIRNFQSEIAVIEKKIDDRKLSIIQLENELIKQRKLYADFILYSYKNHNHFSMAIYLLASDNINQFYLRKKYLEQLKNARVSKIELISKIESRINFEISELDKNRIDINNSIKKMQNEKLNISIEKRKKENSIKDLLGEENALKQALKDKRKIEEEIEKRLSELILEEAKKSKYAKLTPEQELVSADFIKNKGRLPWPTRQGIITETFGEHWHPIIKGVKVKSNGVDITTVEGEVVRSIFSGEVSAIFKLKGTEYTVIVRHGSYRTVYHNLVNLKVGIGDKISTKTTLGYVSKGKEGEDSIVHFEVWNGIDILNPEEWISK